VEFADLPLGEGKVLRVAVAQVTLPEKGTLFPAGVTPDIAIALAPEVQEEIFRRSVERGVSQFVFDSERPRLNEAALVANTNPEIEGYQQSVRERGKAPFRDTVLQRAVDLVSAISFYRDQK